MKQMKKLASVLLLIAVVLTMTVGTAFAANTTSHTITITNDKADHTYTAYQVFAGDISDGKLTNIVWGVGVDGNAVLGELVTLDAYKDCKTAEDVADVLTGFTDDSDELDAFAKVVGKHLATTAGSASAPTDSVYTINVSGDGYYLVLDSASITGNDAATKYILKVVENINVNPKSETPTIDKVIVKADSANGGDGKGTAQDVGSAVDFKLTSKVPAMDGYDTYTYIVNDTMSAGLTFNNNVAVTIDDVTYEDFTVKQNGQSFTITFNNFINQKTNADKDIVITYSATINENALTTDKETNTVNLEYSNDPNNSDSKGNTPDKVVYVYDFDIVIDKWTAGESNTETRLADAKFVLYKMEADNRKLYYKLDSDTVQWVTEETSATEVTTGSDGAAKFQGLDSGTYYLHETAAPAGYNLLKEDVTVEITATYNTDGTLASSSATSTNNGQYEKIEKIENKSGLELPSTGGIGTTIFYVLGAVLVIGAGVLLVTRRRMKKNN